MHQGANPLASDNSERSVPEIKSDALSWVIQGIITGIAFIGVGSILKLSEERKVQGLTTEAGVWMTAAVVVAAGLGSLGVALLSTLFTLIILSFASRVEHRVDEKWAEQIEDKNN